MLSLPNNHVFIFFHRQMDYEDAGGTHRQDVGSNTKGSVPSVQAGSRKLSDQFPLDEDAAAASILASTLRSPKMAFSAPKPTEKPRKPQTPVAQNIG